jgi:hypothetical protein
MLVLCNTLDFNFLDNPKFSSRIGNGFLLSHVQNGSTGHTASYQNILEVYFL